MHRFLGFIKKIEESAKTIPKLLLSHIKHDTRSTTGANLRYIMLRTGKDSIDSLHRSDISDLKYVSLGDNERWKINIIRELINIRDENMKLSEFEDHDVRDMIAYICIN